MCYQIANARYTATHVDDKLITPRITGYLQRRNIYIHKLYKTIKK